MNFLELSPDGSPLHLPLVINGLSTEYFELINYFYLVDLNPNNFIISQVCESPNQCITLDLIDKETNEVVWRFKNKSSVNTSSSNGPTTGSQEIFIMPNPVEKTDVLSSLFGVISIDTIKELAFLKDIPIDTQQSIWTANTEPAIDLAALLNTYNTGVRWVSGTIGDYSTAGFILRYYGVGSDAPPKYLVDRESELVVVIEITEGRNKGVIYLQL